MGRWAECLSQTRNFAKARFSEIWRRDGTLIFIARIALLLKSAESTVAIEPITPYSIKIFISFDTVQYDRKSAGSLLLWRQSGFAFPVHIAQVNAVCQNAARKAGVRRCTGCAGFVTISIMLLMDPAVDAVGGWTTRTMYQRSCSAHLSVPVLPYNSAALTRTKIFTAAKKCCILRCKDTLEKILWTGSKCYE